MLDISQQLARELSVQPSQVDAALALMAEGATVPFIARYRKERTDNLDEIQLRDLSDRYAYLKDLSDRKQAILKAIDEQGRLTPQLKRQILACRQKTELEDLYLPYRPKRRTRATTAREQGLEPLADWLEQLNQSGQEVSDLSSRAAQYVNSNQGPDQGPETAAAALQGAADILAEAIAERANLRAAVRSFLLTGRLESAIKPDYAEGTTKYEMYRRYQIPLREAAPHNLLALLRGQKEGILKLELTFDSEKILAQLEAQVIQTRSPLVRSFYQTLIADALRRLMQPALTSEVIAEKKPGQTSSRSLRLPLT